MGETIVQGVTSPNKNIKFRTEQNDAAPEKSHGKVAEKVVSKLDFQLMLVSGLSAFPRRTECNRSGCLALLARKMLEYKAWAVQIRLCGIDSRDARESGWENRKAILRLRFELMFAYGSSTLPRGNKCSSCAAE